MLNGNGTAPKVVVIGGSLGGLFNAIALRSLGCEVEVFEKSSGLMKDRGAGIVFQQEVAELLTRYAVAPLEPVVVPVRTPPRWSGSSPPPAPAATSKRTARWRRKGRYRRP